MSEAAEVPWDIQIQGTLEGRASGLWRRIKSQWSTLAGKPFTKPVVKGTARQAIGHHIYGSIGDATNWGIPKG